MELHAALYGVMLPVAIVAAVLAGARALRSRCAWLGGARVLPLALAAAAIWSAWQQAGKPPWQPSIAAEWRPASFALTAALAALTWPGAGWRAALSAGVAAAGGVAFLAPPGASAGTRAALACVAGLAAACAAPALAAPTLGGPLAMWGTAAALSALALQAGSAKLAIVAGAFSAMSAAVGVLGLIMRPMQLGAPVAAAWAGMLGGLAAMCLGYADEAEPATCWWLMVAAPAGAGVAAVPAVAARLRLPSRPALRAVVVAAPPLLVALAAVATMVLRASR